MEDVEEEETMSQVRVCVCVYDCGRPAVQSYCKPMLWNMAALEQVLTTIL